MKEVAYSSSGVLERQSPCKDDPEKERYMLADAETKDYSQMLAKALK